MKTTFVCLVVLGSVLAASSCRSRSSLSGSSAPPTPPSVTARPSASARERAHCAARLAEVEQARTLPGASSFEKHRTEILGRVRMSPVYFVAEPAPTPDARLPAAARAARAAAATMGAFRRVQYLRQRFATDRSTLRSLLLRDGYLYSSSPEEALALVSRLRLVDLFDEPEVLLQRGDVVHRLRRTGREYRDESDEPAVLLLGDRVGLSPAALARPLHRDLQGLAHALGFDRAEILRATEDHLVARLRFAGTWATALLATKDARVELSCLDVADSLRQAIDAWRAESAPRRRGLARLREAVDASVREKLPFDRPRGESNAERDGQLRPPWRWAYAHGRSHFEHDQRSYPVFDAVGRPLPPQMCVDFVLDSFERAAGTWYRRRGEPPGRTMGLLDFDSYGIENRRSVLYFGRFAQAHPSLFESSEFAPEDRIPFGDRRRFFAYLRDHSDLFAPGDVVAIRGRKQDGLVHQHAILIEDTDPLTGFPHALADQMRFPRRRSWEAIMAEAPRRSLYFRVRPRPTVLTRLDGEVAAVSSLDPSAMTVR